MPQIWLTYEELSELFKYETSAARQAVIDYGWPRRKSSDWLTRVKLSPTLAHQFMLTYAAKNGLELLTNDMVDRLRGVLRNADGSASDLPRAPALVDMARRIAGQ
jgi:hypothetical protein